MVHGISHGLLTRGITCMQLCVCGGGCVLRDISITLQGVPPTPSPATYTQGQGTVNGSGSKLFIVNVLDGAPDRFRIKITDKTTGALFYDNQQGADESADPTTAISGGSIKVRDRCRRLLCCRLDLT